MMNTPTVVDRSTALVFSGEWEHNDVIGGYEVAYQAVSLGRPWNGFAAPTVTRRVLDALVARQAFLSLLDPSVQYDDIIKDGNGYMVTNADLDEPFWLLPDDDGNFDLTSLGWTFEQTGEDDNLLHVVPS